MPIHLEVLRGNRPDTTTLQGLPGGTPVGTVSFRTRWSLAEVFGWMWLARVFTPTVKGALLRRAEAFGIAPDQLPDPSPYEGRKRRSAGLKNPRQSGMSRRWLKQRTKAASRSPPSRDLNYSEASSLSFGGRRMNFPSTGKAIRSAL